MANEEYKNVFNTIQNMIENKTLTPEGINELEQFKKDYFYNNWLVRYRRIASFTPLGTRGVLAIPNTTFEEWLVWFEAMFDAFLKDYNEFKKLVLEALQLHEKHLQLHDEQIKELQRQVQDIYNKIDQINDRLNTIEHTLSEHEKQINNLRDRIDKLENDNNALVKILENLKNSGAWTQDGNKITDGHLNAGRNIATGNINLFGGSTDGESFIRTNNGQTENDITAGI